MARHLTKNIRKVSGLKSDGTPNAYWRRFKERLTNFESIPINEWAEEEMLGYLLKRFNDHYGIEFSLSYSGPPSKCPEMYCIRRIMENVGTKKGWIMKEYIDWVFDSIIIPQKTKVESLGYFFNQKICNRFKGVFRERQKITRSTALPNDFIIAAQNNGFDIQCYGDLAFMKMAVDNDPNRTDAFTIRTLLQQLESMGFNTAILNSLED